jgi:formylglycine-generating enzyme required for sulfatase activity
MKLRSVTEPAAWTGILRVLVRSALCFFATVFSAAADPGDGTVSLAGATMSPQGFYQFFFEANSAVTYPVRVSDDLVNWTLLTNIVGTGAPLWIEDREAPNFRTRFYHIGIPPTPIPNMVFIAPGTFTMGSPASEANRVPDEGPQTEVTLSKGFWMGKYEVTQNEYIAVTGSNYSFFTYDLRLPLDSQSWSRATNYCHMLTLKERAGRRLPIGWSYRLPTEAEWEYACRAGTTTPVSYGDGKSLNSTQANFDGTFPYGGASSGPYIRFTTLGGKYPPNPWGLYDMHGNLWELCQDWYGPYPGGKVIDPKGPPTGTTRVLRGGGYTSVGASCRSAKRDSRSPDYNNTIQGFRVVLTPD